MQVYLTAIIKTKPEFHEEIKALLLALPAKSMQEEACIRYEVYQDATDGSTFVFQELWRDREGLENHNIQPYSQEFFASFDKLQGDPILYISQ